MRPILAAVLGIWMLVFPGCGKKQVQTLPSESNAPQEFVRLGNEFLAKGDYENAFRAFGVVYEKYPQSTAYIDAVIGLSKCYGAFKDYQKQFDLLYALVREEMVPSRVPEIYTLIAEFYERSAGISEELTGEGSKDYEIAIGYLKKAVEYESSQDTLAKAYAQFKIGQIYEMMGDYEHAIGAYQDTINRFGGTQWANLAEQQIALIREKRKLQMEYEQLKSAQQPDTTRMVAPESPEPTPAQEDTSQVPLSGPEGEPR